MLRYTVVGRHSGATVRFAERGGRGASADLGAARRGGPGRSRSRPASGGSGRRDIVALVARGGVPASASVVARYTAPAAQVARPTVRGVQRPAGRAAPSSCAGAASPGRAGMS